MRVKICLSEDEWYPVYEPRVAKPGMKVHGSVSAEKLEHWKEVFKEFNKIQKALQRMNDRYWDRKMKGQQHG